MQLKFFSILLTLVLVFSLGACHSNRAADPTEPYTPYEFVFVGDILLGDAAQTLLDADGYHWPFDGVRDLLAGDFVIGNGEGPITTLSEPWDPDQRWSYNSQPLAAEELSAAGFDALGYANNHALDRGPEGLADTIAILGSQGITVFGAGADEHQAAAPLLVETPYGIVGIVALNEDWGDERTATEDQAGSIPLNRDNIRRGYRLARDAGAEWFVAYVHWGSNYAEVDQDQRSWAELIAKTGYDLVIGHGAHSLQEVEILQGIPVFYSLGNFVFNTPGRFNEDFPGYGLVMHAHLGPQGFTSASISCIQTDNQIVSFQPQPCSTEQAAGVFEGLGIILSLQDNTAELSW